MLEQYLEDLERRISPQIEDRLLDEWTQFVDSKWNYGIFSPKRQKTAPPTVTWPDININDAIENFDLMALHQFGQCSRMLEEGSGQLLNVRCNYGTGILPSLFGVEMFIMPRETNTLPTNKPLAGGKETIKVLLDRGMPDIHSGLGGKVFEMAEQFLAMMKDYPKIQRYVRLYHPDVQGPIDVCELLWGSDIFIDLIDTPELVSDLLDLVTETYIAFMREWFTLVPASTYSAHWSLMHKGAIMLRDDSAMNVSPRMFKKFIEPYDQRLLTEFGGGAIHFCGRGDHYIRHIGKMQGVYAVNMSQPEYNDIEKIFQHTVDQGIKLLGLSHETAEQAMQQGRELHGNVHCW